MRTKHILLLAPTLVMLVLLQSYFWVPTYEKQTRGNPRRLSEFITASIGDAGILNPILSADSASSDINAMVFEGLIDRDRDLAYRGRLAEHWDLYEEAFFHTNPDAVVPGLGRVSAEALAAYLRRTFSPPYETIITVLPAHRFTVQRPLSDNPVATETVRLTVSAPPRIKLTLAQVDQELFEKLEAILGPDYFSTFNAESRVTCNPPVPDATRHQWARELLPPTEHNPVLVFHLRNGVRFHDGHMVDAEDVQFTYQSIMDPRNLSPRVSDYEPVKSVEVIAPLTLRVVYKRLYAPAVSSWSMGILPEHLLNDAALAREAARLGKDPATFTLRDSGFNRHPVGCGPFRFREWKSDRYISLDRFEQYWEGAPNYRRYVYRIIPDPLTQEMEFYAGTVDNYAVQPHQVDRLASDERFQHFSGTALGYTYIAYNLRRPPFDDPRVRRAMGMAIDVDKIITHLLYGQGERITGPFPKQTDYYNHAIAPLPYDPEGALSLLAEAGWHLNAKGRLEKDGKPLRFTLITNSGNDLRKAILAIAQDAWRAVGIDVRTDLLEWSVFIQERVNKLDFDALVLGWQMGLDPDLYQIWHSSQTAPHQLNFVGFDDPRADDLILKIRREYDKARQVDFCHRLHAIIAQEQPYTFLYVGKWTAVLDKRIVIRETGPDGTPQYRPITPTATGSYAFDFNRWIKLPHPPQFSDRL